MSGEASPTTQRLISAIENGEIHADGGYLVGLDRPALLSPDRAAAMAAGRPAEILASGHRWRVVTEPLWLDLLILGRERPLQRVYVLALPAIEVWLANNPGELSDLEPDGWRGNQGTAFVLPYEST